MSEPLSEAEVRHLVNVTKWYHGWEILPGLHTGGPSKTDPEKVLDRYGVPRSLTGLRALDIGAWDGPYSFELARRGATVVSFDIQDPNCTAYNVTRRILNLQTDYIKASVYDLDQQEHGKFDIVLFLGVYYHLKHPMLAWQKIRAVMNPTATMYFEGAVLDWAWKIDKALAEKQAEIDAVKSLPIAYFSAGNYADCWSNWYIPTAKCLNDWITASGFCVENIGYIESSSRAYGRASLNASADLSEHGLSQANV